MKFQYHFKWNQLYFFQKTALILAAENNNEEIVKILLENPNIDVNLQGIFS